MKWDFWKKERRWGPSIMEGVLGKKQEESVEDLTMIRNLKERLANIQLGNAFGLSTREGVKIFKYVELREHPKKESTK